MKNCVGFSSSGSYEYIRTINITDVIRICEAWNTKQEYVIQQNVTSGNMRHLS
jgi:hypothetical protein